MRFTGEPKSPEWDYGAAVAQQTVNLLVDGSNPSIPANLNIKLWEKRN